MRFVTVKDKKFKLYPTCSPSRRDWQPDDVPESLMRDLFEDWDFVNDALDDDLLNP